MSARPLRSLGERIILALPFIWLILFFLAPLAIVLKISFSQPAMSQPPYSPAFDWFAGPPGWISSLRQFTLQAYAGLVDEWLYVQSLASSLKLAALATILSLLIAYPMACAMARAPKHWRLALVALAMAPFWTSFLIRVYAWIAILKDEGLLNHALISVGLIAEPLHIFASDYAVLIGIVYSYLPFMILPLYTSIAGRDHRLLEAASDLGATPAAVFWRVTVPLSRPGIIAGCLLVFIPATGEFVIPDLLGGSDTLMIGRLLWTDFFDNRDWPAACAAAVLLIALLILPVALRERIQLARRQGAQ